MSRLPDFARLHICARTHDLCGRGAANAIKRTRSMDVLHQNNCLSVRLLRDSYGLVKAHSLSTLVSALVALFSRCTIFTYTFVKAQNASG
jgi:hypothetical protein